MEEVANIVAEGPVQETVRKENRGWFRAGDRRINREGRPRGSKIAPKPSVILAPQTDRVMLLILPKRHLAFRLRMEFAFWITNLPRDLDIVSCQLNSARNGFVFLIRSSQFPRIAKGTPIPQFRPEFNGLKWHN